MVHSKVVLSNKNYFATAKMKAHSVFIDIPKSEGGGDIGPTPVAYLLTAIGGCVAMTLRMYAERKNWEVGKITVNVAQLEDEDGFYLSEEISFEKEITETQKERLLFFAGKCPVARMVKGETRTTSKII
jgi:putative redox protein